MLGEGLAMSRECLEEIVCPICLNCFPQQTVGVKNWSTLWWFPLSLKKGLIYPLLLGSSLGGPLELHQSPVYLWKQRWDLLGRVCLENLAWLGFMTQPCPETHSLPPKDLCLSWGRSTRWDLHERAQPSWIPSCKLQGTSNFRLPGWLFSDLFTLKLLGVTWLILLWPLSSFGGVWPPDPGHTQG